MQGDLLCCETCPAVMHAQCAGLDRAPSGDWHCPSCTCVACGYAATTPAEEQSLPQVGCRARQDGMQAYLHVAGLRSLQCSGTT